MRGKSLTHRRKTYQPRSRPKGEARDRIRVILNATPISRAHPRHPSGADR
jgi:hypothetical protein